MGYELILGDCYESLKNIADQTVQCVVTSPPYYGLRDYGTAKWDGGDITCDHKNHKWPNDNKNPNADMPPRVGSGINPNVCPAGCGAIRTDSQIGLEKTPKEYVAKLVTIFQEVKRILKDDGVFWLIIGDSYASNGKIGQTDESTGWKHGKLENEKRSRGRGAGNGIKPKDLIGIPWMVAFALRDNGWYLRQDIIWAKPNPMPESVKDRCTKSHEYIFLLTKNKRYFCNMEAIEELATGYDGRKDTEFKGSVKNYNGVMPNGQPQSFAQNGHERWKYKNLQEDGQKPNTMHLKRLVGDEYLSPVRNKRDVWTVNLKPYRGAHFAVYPPELIEPCILAGTSKIGECPECGKAWIPIREKPDSKEKDWDTVKPNTKGIKGGSYNWQPDPHRKERISPIESSNEKTIGWKPQCKCFDGYEQYAVPVPQTVLDPFSGAGTTGLVALRNGCNYIGLELNPEYIELTKKRLENIT